MSLNTTPGEYSYTFKYSFKCSWILRRPSSEICIFWEPVSWKYIAFTDLHVLVLLLVAAWIFAGNLPFCFMKWVVSLDMYLSMKYSWKMHIWTTLLSLWSITLYNRFLPVGLKSNLWERQGTPYVYGSSGLSCSGGSTRNRIVGVRTHPHRVKDTPLSFGLTPRVQKTHIPWLNAISELPIITTRVSWIAFGMYVVCRHYWRVLLQSSSKW